MGFETKRKPVLESIMSHHGLLITRQGMMSSDDMHNTIVSHIASGHCAQSINHPRAWLSQKTHMTLSSFDPHIESVQDMTCDDFTQDADLRYEDPVGNEIKTINKILEKSPSRALLLRFLQQKEIPHDPLDSCKRLRTTLTRFERVLEKCCVRHPAIETSPTTNDWPSVIPQTLKDKIAENFRKEFSQDQLQSFVCCSCSSSVFVKERTMYSKHQVNLNCLQHPEMRLSGIPPDLSYITTANLDPCSLAEGLLLD